MHGSGCMYVCMYVCMYACIPAPQGHHRATGGRRGTQHTHQQHRSKQCHRPGQHHNPAPQGHRGGRGIPTIHHALGGVGVATLYHIYNIIIKYIYIYDMLISVNIILILDNKAFKSLGQGAESSNLSPPPLCLLPST